MNSVLADRDRKIAALTQNNAALTQNVTALTQDIAARDKEIAMLRRMLRTNGVNGDSPAKTTRTRRTAVKT